MLAALVLEQVGIQTPLSPFEIAAVLACLRCLTLLQKPRKLVVGKVSENAKKPGEPRSHRVSWLARNVV